MAATKPKKRNSKPKAKKDIKKSIKRAGKQTAAEPELTTLARRLRMTRLERSVISVPLTKPGGKSKDFGRVQDFLKHYGYLGDKLSRGVLDKATKRAISNYQKFYGLDVTGAFDRATRAHMSQPRCGLPDRLSTSTSALTIVRKDCARDKCEITYAFDEGPNSGGFGNFVAFNAVRRAIATWERHLLLTFREVSLNDAPDVRIGWRPSNDPDFADLAGPSIAHADFPGSCSVLDREIATDPVPVHFERSEDLIWGDGDEDEHDIESVALHEWGHVLGLLHSNNPDAVMRAFIEPGDVRRDPHYDDLANLSALYPGYRRHGDSGNDAGVVRSNAALRHRDDQVLTAVRTASDTLRLIAWRVEGGSGPAHRRQPRLGGDHLRGRHGARRAHSDGLSYLRRPTEADLLGCG